MALDADETDTSEQSHRSQRTFAVFEPIRSSFSLQVAAAGVGFIALGSALGTGVWAGMVPIWGFAAVLVGLGSYAFMTLSRRRTKG